jgi:hypothetical protein
VSLRNALAQPSFCSSAIYLVFVSTLEELNRKRKIQFEPGVVEKLLVSGQRDGDGVWNDQIGAKEFGHSVVVKPIESQTACAM